MAFHLNGYSNFHELNEDWIISLVKKWGEEFDQLSNLIEYVTNYFDNLDIQEEVSNKINEMLQSGELADLLKDYFDYATPEMFGAAGDGVRDDTAEVKMALLTKLPVIGTKTYKITEEIELTDNDYISLKNISMLQDIPCLFRINGDNVCIKNTTSTGFQNAIFAEIENANNVTIENCDISNYKMFVHAYDKDISGINILKNKSLTYMIDILLNKVRGSDTKVSGNYFSKTGRSAHAGNIRINGNVGVFTLADFMQNVTDSDLDTKYENITISENTSEACNSRFVYCINCKNVNVLNNVHNGLEGKVTMTDVSDDVYIVEWCDTFNIKGNISNNSGQNGIDSLSSVNGNITNNILRNCYASGLMFDVSDVYTLGYASAVSVDNLWNKNISYSDNDISAAEFCVEIRIATDLTGSNNILNEYSDIVDLRTGRHFAINQPPAILNIMNVDGKKIENIICNGNVIDKEEAEIYIAYTSRVVWGSVYLGESMALYSPWIDVNQYDIKAWQHNKGIYNNMKLYFYIDPSSYAHYNITNPNQVAKNRVPIKDWWSEWDASGNRNLIHGTQIIQFTENEVIIEAGAYITGYKNRTIGVPANLGTEVSGKIKIALF